MRRPKPAEVRKALVALAAFLAQLIAAGVVPPDVLPYVTAVLAALAALGVYAVPNDRSGDDGGGPGGVA